MLKLVSEGEASALGKCLVKQARTRELVNVEHVRTSLNLADIFTKILSATDHNRIRQILMGNA